MRLPRRGDEFFDAEEYIDELDSEPEGEEFAFRLAVHAGGVSFVLLDDHDALGCPLLMASLEPLASRGCSVARVAGALTLDASLRLAVFAYTRAAAEQGWEPVLEPCHLALALDTKKRLFSFTSCGNLEVNVSPAFVRLAVPLLGRATVEGRGQRRASAPFAPFRLRNVTGSRLSCWADGAPRTTLEAGAAVSLDSSRVGDASLFVEVDGFQRLKLHPPFRARYRLFSADSARARRQPIVNLLTSVSKAGESVVLTLLTPFHVQNRCDASVRLRISAHDGSVAPAVEVRPAERYAVPLGFQCGWIAPAVDAPVSWDARAPEARVELAVAALHAMRGRGVVRLRCGRQSCYHVAAELQQPHNTWLISLHPPLVLRNALLRELEYEISVRDVRAPVARGKLAQGDELPLLEVFAETYVRVRCAGFQWSEPALLHVSGAAEPARAAPPSEPQERRLRCPASSAAAPPHAGHDARDAGLFLRLLLAHSDTGLVAEVCGWIWLRNETDWPLHFEALAVAAAPSTVPALVVEPLRVGASSELPDVRLTALDDPQPQSASSSRSCVLALGELLRADGEELQLEGLRHRELGFAAVLDVGAKLCHLPHQLGTSLLLTVSPRVVLVNQTGRPFLCQQRGCDHTFQLPPCAADAASSVPILWDQGSSSRQLLLRRPDRGAEWSGGIQLHPVGSALEGGAELTLRLRNLETGVVEFPRLSVHQLADTPTAVLLVQGELPDAAPVLVRNFTSEEVRFQQVNVAAVCTVPPRASCPYAWDDAAGQHVLVLSVPTLGAHFRCGLAPCRRQRPLLARFLRRAHVELRVATEGALTLVELHPVQSRWALSPRRAASPPVSAASPTASSPPLRRLRTPRASSSPPPGAGQRAAGWLLRVQVPTLGVSFFDDQPRETLHFSVRGVRLAAESAAPLRDLSFSLAVATLQLDCLCPCVRDPVVLRAGASVRRDAIHLSVTRSSLDHMTLLQDANASLQEVHIQIDQEVFDALASTVEGLASACGTASHDDSGALRNSEAQGSSGPLSLHSELQELGRRGSGALHRTFVHRFRVAPVKLRLSIQLAPRPAGEAPATLLAVLLRGLRWLGITLVHAERLPVGLPEVLLQRVLLPRGGLLQEVQQRYTFALMHARRTRGSSSALPSNSARVSVCRPPVCAGSRRTSCCPRPRCSATRTACCVGCARGGSTTAARCSERRGASCRR